MKKLILHSVIAAILLASCVSSKSLLNQGRYDEAIEKSVAKLRKDPNNKSEINILEQAYRIANQKNNDRITFLKKEGNPQSWDEVFNLYSILKKRQEFVGTLSQTVLAKIGYQPIDYDNEIIAAKKNAVEYYYVHAQKLLESGNKTDARKAYAELLRVKEFYENYKDVDKLIYQAKDKGMSYVLFVMKNNSYAQLPQGFEEELTDVSLYQLNDMWIYFENKETPGRKYDYIIRVNMKAIEVSPERISEKQEVESKQVEDGWQYVLDEKGNVKKDSAGNDIKIKKYKTITCKYIETTLSKAGKISGTIDFIDNNTGNILKSDPITAEHFFNYQWYNANGDLNALKPETRKKVEASMKPIPFPPDLAMIGEAGKVLKKMTKDIVYSNKYLLK